MKHILFLHIVFAFLSSLKDIKAFPRAIKEYEKHRAQEIGNYVKKRASSATLWQIPHSSMTKQQRIFCESVKKVDKSVNHLGFVCKVSRQLQKQGWPRPEATCAMGSDRF